MKKLSFDEKYAVIGGADASQYEGLFITAVSSTGIFCRPTCTVRKPNRENVIFYDTPQQALQNGYRPCKRCKPMEKLGATPDYIEKLVKELHDDPYLRLKDQNLRERGIEPARLRRWFKAHHNITFHAYQRMLRINIAYRSIQKGESITNAAFDSGHGSLSGFNDGYHSIFGASASDSSNKSVLNITRFTTPIGPMFACASQKGVCLLDFTDRRMLETEFNDLRKRLDAVILPGDNEYLEQVQIEIEEYFAGKRQSFTVPLDAPGTDFQQGVWKVLQTIPYGETRSYKQQAIALGNPKAVRAVASANGHNRIAIIIPCHRVIGSNGKLVGYGGGLHRKQFLLDLEMERV